MEHVVFFPAPDGSPAFRRVTSLEEAVRLVEHLRNEYSVDAVSVHALTEVPLSFRAYYKVEVPAEAAVPQAPVAEQVAPVAEPAPQAAPEPTAELVPEQAGEASVAPAAEVVLDAPAAHAEVPALLDDAAALEAAPVPTPAKVPLGRSGSLGFFAR